VSLGDPFMPVNDQSWCLKVVRRNKVKKERRKKKQQRKHV
jgi:hypothetical protein